MKAGMSRVGGETGIVLGEFSSKFHCLSLSATGVFCMYSQANNSKKMAGFKSANSQLSSGKLTSQVPILGPFFGNLFRLDKAHSPSHALTPGPWLAPLKIAVATIYFCRPKHT